MHVIHEYMYTCTDTYTACTWCVVKKQLNIYLYLIQSLLLKSDDKYLWSKFWVYTLHIFLTKPTK